VLFGLDPNPVRGPAVSTNILAEVPTRTLRTGWLSLTRALDADLVVRVTPYVDVA
jgi:hypothetical protein